MITETESQEVEFKLIQMDWLIFFLRGSKCYRSFKLYVSSNQTLVSNLSRILFSAGGGGGDTIDWDGKQADNFLRRLRMKHQLD